MYDEWAREYPKLAGLPHVLSIKLNRAPCEPCARELFNLLQKHKHLSIRIQASALTADGVAGIKYLGVARVIGMPIYFRAWAPEDVATKYKENVTDFNIKKFRKYKGKTCHNVLKDVNWEQVRSPSDLNPFLGNLQPGDPNSLRRYQKAWQREIGWPEDDLHQMAEAYYIRADELRKPWRDQGLSKADLLGLQSLVEPSSAQGGGSSRPVIRERTLGRAFLIDLFRLKYGLESDS